MDNDPKKHYICVDYFEDLTGEIADSKKEDTEEIGQRVANLRKDKGLSLEELASLTGFDISFLSDIENNRIHPQLGTLIKLSKALDAAVGRIISGVGDKPYSVTRKADRKTISRSTSQKGEKDIYVYRDLAPEVKGRHMEALIVQLAEGPNEERSMHEGEEFIFVLDGVVVLEIGEEVFDLEPGDSAYYLSTTPHLVASKKGHATIVAVLYEG